MTGYNPSSFDPEGFKRFLHGMDRRIKDLERRGDWRFDDEELDDDDALAGIFPRTILDYGAPDWRYNVIARTDTTDYSAQAFDDSAWSVGTATFGASTGTSPRTITTTTSLDTAIWLRRPFSGNLTNVTVTVMADNVGEAWWNGTYLGTFTLGAGNVSGDENQFTVPASALDPAGNVLAVRVVDDGPQASDHHYADAKVVAATAGLVLDDLTDVDTTSTAPADGDALIYDASSGLWLPGAVTAAGGDFALIDRQTLASDTASVTFSSIPSAYRDLVLMVRGRGTGAGANTGVRYRFNGDSSAWYNFQRHYTADGTSYGSETYNNTSGYIGELPASTAPAAAAGQIEMVVGDYVDTTFHKTALSQAGHQLTSTTMVAETIYNRWTSTAAVTQLDLFPVGGSFAAGSTFSLYGRS